MTPQPLFKPAWSLRLVALSIIASLAVYFRFFHFFELFIYSSDQGRALLAGRNILLGHFTLTGPLTSIPGFHLGPLYYYATALALWVTHFHPAGPTALVALCGVAATLLLFFYLEKYWGFMVATIAGVLYALSPLVIHQSRIAIEPSPLPLITLAWLWCTTEWQEGRLLSTSQAEEKTSGRLPHLERWLRSGGWWFIGALMCIFIGAQLNFSAIMLLPVMAWLWLMQTKLLANVDKQRLTLAGGVAAMAAIAGKAFYHAPTSVGYFWRTWMALTTPLSAGAAVVLLLLFFITIGLVVHRHRWLGLSDSQVSIAKILYAWLFVGGLGFLIKTVGGEHSLGLLFPLPSIFFAVLIHSLLRRSKFWPAVVFCTLGTLLLTLNAMFYFSSLKTGTLQEHERTVTAILAAAHNEPYALVYRGHLDVYDAADDHLQYLLWWHGAAPVDSARLHLEDQYREHWLLDPQPEKAKRTLYIYFPASATNRYEVKGKLLKYPTFTLEVVER